MIKKLALLFLFCGSAAFGQVYTTLYLPTVRENPSSSLYVTIAAGRVFCGTSMVNYAGGNLLMTASTTNYVYLNTASSCALAVKTSTFVLGDIPIAVVVAGSSTITSVGDRRTAFSKLPSVAGATWGSITGTLSSQTDLQTALNAKAGFPGAGIPKSTGSGWTSPVVYSDIVALFGGGSCSGYLKNDGMCSTPNSIIGSQFAPTDGGSRYLAISAGTIMCNGSPITKATQSVLIGAFTTSYVFLDPGVIGCDAQSSPEPATAGQVPIALVVTNGSTITSITDQRPLYLVGSVGSFFGVSPGSSLLQVKLSAGKYSCNGVLTTINQTDVGVGASATTTIYLDPGTSCSSIHLGSTFPTGVIPIATVVADGTHVTDITDNRPLWLYNAYPGVTSDGANGIIVEGTVAAGATNPVTIGGASGSCAGKVAMADGTGCVSNGSGSGTVNSGTTNQIAVYPSAGTAVQGAASSTLPQTVAWEKKGTVISGGATSASVVQEPTPFLQPVPAVLTNVPTGAQALGMFYTSGYGSPLLKYTESLDGIHWTPSSITIAAHMHSCTATISGTIYIAAANTSGTGIDMYSFASPTVTSVKTNIVTNGGGGFKNAFVGNCGFFKDLDGTYPFLYDGQSAGGNWTTGLATCTAPGGGMACPDYVTNPVLNPLTAGGTMGNPKSVRQLAVGSYVMWPHGTPLGVTGVLPTDGYFGTAPSPHGPWAVGSTSTLYRTEPIEGVNTATGQIADQAPITFNGRCYNFYTQFPNGNNGLNGGIGLSIANLPCEQLAAVTQTVSVPSPGIGLSSYGPPLRAAANNVAITTGTAHSFASVSLTPGTWLVSGNIEWKGSGGNNLLYYQGCITTSSVDCASVLVPDRMNQNDGGSGGTGTPVVDGGDWDNPVAMSVITVTATTSYYINGSTGFTGGTVAGNGSITAVRVY